MFFVAARHRLKKTPNWQSLFGQLRILYKSYGMDRKAAVLDNHDGNKEAICRKLGVICEADIRRIESGMPRNRRVNA